jgi:uncharacterized protein YggE
MRALFIITIVGGMLQAQEFRSSAGNPPALRVHGEATVSAEPDQAQFDIGVVTQAASVSTAVDRNAAQTNAVMREVRGMVPDKDIKTVNFAVNPNYRYPKEGGTATIDGYTANNTVRLTLNDISKIPAIIEVATKSGANNVNRLSFLLKDERPVRAKALAAAAMQAEAGAEALAGSLKLKLGRLLQVEEGQPVVISPARQMNFGRAESTDITPISPGTIDVHANVDITYEIIQEQPPGQHQH